MASTENEATTILVTPVWNDSRRLAGFGPELAAELARRGRGVKWVIADDGSSVEEVIWLEKLVGVFEAKCPDVTLHRMDEHRGKGAVVRDAWARFPEAEWFAFVDADGSVPASEIMRLIEQARATGKSTIGIRKDTAETRVEETAWRRARHLGFLAACRFLLGLDTQDSQCGAKVIKGADYRAVRDRLEEEGFAFDAELLAELEVTGRGWDEVPVSWFERFDSRISHGSWWPMLMALWRIRGRLGAEAVSDRPEPRDTMTEP